MEILLIIAAGICLAGVLGVSMLAVCVGRELVRQDRNKQESAKVVEEPKLCFDNGCSYFEAQMIVARLLAEDKKRKKRRL